MRRSIWRGKLATQDRKPEEFEAEIVEVDGKLALLKHEGLNVTEISPHQVNGESWMKALADLRGPKKR